MSQENVPEQPVGERGFESTPAINLGKAELIAKVQGLMTKIFPDFEISTLSIPPTYQRKVHQIDLLLGLRSKDRSLRLAIKVKPLGYPSRIFQVVASFKRMPRMSDEYPMVVTDQISKEGASLARQAGIGYLDLEGNCYLDFEGLCLEKTAVKKTKRMMPPLKHLFSPKATRVIRTLIEFGSKSWPTVE